MVERGIPADRIDTSRPHPARIYDYVLGGRDNYEVDREAAEELLASTPTIREAMQANRAFMERAVRALVQDYGIRQIIDIGTGIPTSPNTHEIAQAIEPRTRVVYADNDPIVGVHANARLRGTGETGFALADARDPRSVLDHPATKALIDFSQPVGVLLIAVLHFVADQEDPRGIIRTLRDGLPSGSFLALTHGTADFVDDRGKEAVRIYSSSTATLNLRPRREVEALFEGFELVEPGLVMVSEWRPDVEVEEPRRHGVYGAVGRKP